jgi:hypothetical protein
MCQFSGPTQAALDYNSTIIGALELSEKKWVLAVQLPGVSRHSRHVLEACGDGLASFVERQGQVRGGGWPEPLTPELRRPTSPMVATIRLESSRSPVASCMLLREARRLNMFSIEWLHNGAVAETETSLLQTVEEVIETARLRRVSLSIRLRDRAPDSYRLKDASGNVIGVYSIDGKIDAPRS